MGPRVGRSTLFGIPLQQQWSYANSGDFAPTYYLHSDAPLYYYSFTDAYIASVYRSLRVGKYALGNLLYYPAPNVMMGGELQWGRRENFSDGFQSDGFKIQFSFKYNFSWKLGG